ncbi:MAG: MATE family efflux transporter [Eubacteriales bacterium]|nr:MATE family efflux transporter [Eubacteriales bacterium]
MKKSKKHIDLTTGGIGSKLVAFALPLLIGSLIQQLYGAVDLIFAGREIGKTASAAIGTSSMLITCLVGFFGGLNVGSGVIIAQLIGEKKDDKVRSAIQSALTLSLAGGIIFMAAGYLLAPVFLTLLRTPAEIKPEALLYLRIYFLSFLAIFVYNLGSGILRALGDSRTPLYAQLIGGLANVAMDYWFIHLMKNGVSGVAWATLISQTAAALAVLWGIGILPREWNPFRAKWKYEGQTALHMIRIGVPAGLQSLVITLSNVMAQYHINQCGSDAIAAFAAYYKIELLIYYPIVAMGQASQVFTAQNYGAGKLQRMKRGTWISLGICGGSALVISLISLFFGSQLFSVFTKDPDVIRVGIQLIQITFPFYFIYSVLQILGDGLRGMGETKRPMQVILVNICLIRTALLFILVPVIGDARGIAMVYPITWFLTGLGMIPCYLAHFRKISAEKKRSGVQEAC